MSKTLSLSLILTAACIGTIGCTQEPSTTSKKIRESSISAAPEKTEFPYKRTSVKQGRKKSRRIR